LFGGSGLVAGQPVPLANVVVNLQGTITSRLIGSGSEALLMIDEPGAVGLGGVGPANHRTFAPTRSLVARHG